MLFGRIRWTVNEIYVAFNYLVNLWDDEEETGNKQELNGENNVETNGPNKLRYECYYYFFTFSNTPGSKDPRG